MIQRYDGPILPFVVFGAPILAVVLLLRGVKNVIGWSGDNPAHASIILLGLILLISGVVWLRRKTSEAPHWSEQGIRED